MRENMKKEMHLVGSFASNNHTSLLVTIDHSDSMEKIFQLLIILRAKDKLNLSNNNAHLESPDWIDTKPRPNLYKIN